MATLGWILFAGQRAALANIYINTNIISENVGTKITRIHIESSDIHHSFIMPHRQTYTHTFGATVRFTSTPSKRPKIRAILPFYLMAHTHTNMLLCTVRSSAAVNVVCRSMLFWFSFRAVFHEYLCLANEHKTEPNTATFAQRFSHKTKTIGKRAQNKTTRKCAMYFDSLFGVAHEKMLTTESLAQKWRANARLIYGWSKQKMQLSTKKWLKTM